MVRKILSVMSDPDSNDDICDRPALPLKLRLKVPPAQVRSLYCYCINEFCNANMSAKLHHGREKFIETVPMCFVYFRSLLSP
jgi:hypothetical protein